MLAIIRRTFQNLGKEIVVPLYKSLVKPVWCPYELKYDDMIEV